MNREEYYKEVYSKFWAAQSKQYGYSPIEQYVVNSIVESSPKNIFEVGIGTGWPVAVNVKSLNSDICIFGCDISDISVQEAKKNLEDESDHIFAGTIEDCKESGFYDVVYCVRTSWYISNFYEALEKMITMTSRGGKVIFDIMDKHSKLYLKAKIHLAHHQLV